jgi:hypothetical protein
MSEIINQKNWVGNKNSIYKTLGASNHTEGEREKNDYYATDPKAMEMLLNMESFKNVLEPSAGEGHLSKVIENAGIKITSYDLIDRGYCPTKDFFDIKEWNGDIITNPPYKFAQQFIEHALNIIPVGNKIAMFLKIQFLEGKKRRKLFDVQPPKTVYVSSSRITCALNADFERMKKNGGSAAAYCWFIWERGFRGDTIIKWFN